MRHSTKKNKLLLVLHLCYFSTFTFQAGTNIRDEKSKITYVYVNRKCDTFLTAFTMLCPTFQLAVDLKSPEKHTMHTKDNTIMSLIKDFVNGTNTALGNPDTFNISTDDGLVEHPCRSCAEMILHVSWQPTGFSGP